MALRAARQRTARRLPHRGRLCVLQRQPCGSQPVIGRAGPAGAGVGVRRQDRLSLPGAGPPPVVQDVLPGGGRYGATALRGQQLEGRAGAEGQSGAAFRHPRPSAATVGPTGLGPAEPDPDAPGADSHGGRSGRVVQRQHGCFLGTGATYRCRLETDRLRGQDHPGAPGAAHARLEPELLQPGRGGTARAWPDRFQGPVPAAVADREKPAQGRVRRHRTRRRRSLAVHSCRPAAITPPGSTRPAACAPRGPRHCRCSWAPPTVPC